MLNFAVGPVPMSPEIRALGVEDIPYFRTGDFSAMMRDSERMLLDFAHAPQGSRAIFPTSSGTGAMEATVMGTLDPACDRALIVDGGSFGHRFREMLSLHGIMHDAVELEYGRPLMKSDLEPFEGKGYTAFLVNLGETSQGMLYDSELIADFCSRNKLFLIVDGISSFLADPFDMESMSADVLITDAQKALACPPGIAPMVLSPRALDRAEKIRQPCMYFDLVSLLRNQERGQTPFTPAVGILLQIHRRLEQISEGGGVDAEVSRCAKIAEDFRQRMRASGLPLDMRLESPSNAVTYLATRGFSARAIFECLESDYGIWVCPNGGETAESAFRVGHIGFHTPSDNSMLVSALSSLKQRGLMEPRNRGSL